MFNQNKTNMNHFKFFRLLPVLAIFILPSCKPEATHEAVAEINMDSVKMKIQALESAFAAASNKKDVDGVAAYYANDAQSMAPMEPTRVGMDAIKAGIQKDMAGDTSGYTMSQVVTGVWGDGKYITETGTWSNTDKEGKVMRTGKFMTLFELRDGNYKAIRDIWNSDSPPTK